MQGWRMAKPRTGKRQDVRTRSSVTTGPAVWFFQLFQLFPITAIFLNLIAACCSIGTSLPLFFLIVLCKGSLHSIWLRLFSIFLRGIVAVAAGPFLDFDSPWFSFRQAAPSPRVSWHRRRDPKFADSLPAAGTQLESWRSEGGKRILGTSLIK